MKDKIFLIWSGDNSVAIKIKRILENEYSYICYVGGNYDNTSDRFSIGDTVISQMKMCNQAIVLFKNKQDSGVSSNLFFELGYVSASYGMKKVHCVKRDNESILLPSDFDNSFVESISGADDDEYSRNIVKYFIERQKLSVDTNKMFLINNRYIMHDMISAHYSENGSKCSDYELAQYILFYMQAAVMAQDDKKILDELKTFKRHHFNEFSPELNIAIILSIGLLEVQTSLITEEENVYLPEENFRQYYKSCKDILQDIQDDNSGLFDEWARLFAAENLSFACSLAAANPHIDSESRKYLYEKTIHYGQKSLQYVATLEEGQSCIESNDIVGLLSLFRAYQYRHLFLANKDPDREEAGKWLKLTLSERKRLLTYYDANSIDSKIYDNFEMEYFVSLLEYIDFFGKDNIDSFEYRMYLSDVDAFIEKMNKTNSIHSFVKKIVNQRKKV